MTARYPFPSEGFPVKHRTARRVAALSIVVGLLAAAGCSDDKETTSGAKSPTGTSSSTPTVDPNAKPSAADRAAVAKIKVEGKAGAEPKVTFSKGVKLSAITTKVVSPGTGEVLKDGQQVSINLVVYNGSDGSKVEESYTQQPLTLILGDASVLTQWNEVLTGQKVGARFIVALPEGANAAYTQILAAEVMSTKTLPSRASGTAVAPAAGLPAVKLDAKGVPSITIPKGYAKPTALVTQTLIKGTGPVVKESDSIVVHYSGWKLDGEVFDSSWEQGSPMTRPLSSLIAGWKQGIAGQTVGSQVLLVVPPSLAYGDDATSQLKDETLIFVVDILDASS